MFQNKDLVNIVVQKIFELVTGTKKRGTNKINFRCPICHDSAKSQRKMRGWYSLKTGTYKCFNGGCSAYGTSWSSLKFLSFIQNKTIKEVKSDIISELKNTGTSSVDIIKQLLTEQTEQSETNISLKNTDISIPNNWIDYKENDICKKIIEDRKIFEADYVPKNWKLYFDTERNKLVIPWIRNKKIIYYQYRTLFKHEQPKYSFPSDMNKDLFGLDSLDMNFPYIFLIEGVFDTIFVKNGICIGGVCLTDYQRDLLEIYKQEGYKFVWLFDNQWTDNTGKETSLKALERNESVFIWPRDCKEKDVNDCYLKYGKNLFSDEKFLTDNIYVGAKGLLRLKFNR